MITAPIAIQAGRAMRRVPAVRVTAARPTTQIMYWGLSTLLTTIWSKTSVNTKSRLIAASAKSRRPRRIARSRANHHSAAARRTSRPSHLSASAIASATWLEISGCRCAAPSAAVSP